MKSYHLTHINKCNTTQSALPVSLPVWAVSKVFSQHNIHFLPSCNCTNILCILLLPSCSCIQLYVKIINHHKRLTSLNQSLTTYFLREGIRQMSNKVENKDKLDVDFRLMLNTEVFLRWRWSTQGGL